LIRAARAFGLSMAMLLFAGCGFGVGFEKPIVTFQRLELVSASFAGLETRVVLKVENPNWQALDLVRLAYRITLDGKPILQGATDPRLHVPEHGAGELAVPVKLTLSGLFATLEALVARSDLPWTMHAELGFGTPLGVLTVPVDAHGVVPVPRLPSLTLDRVDVAEVGLSGANLDVTVSLDNPNPQPLTLGPFRFALGLNGTPVAESALEPKTVPGATRQSYRVTMHVDLLRVGAQIVGSIASRSAQVSLDGALTLGPFTLPLHLQQTLR
jgi:LEA14-like dessication related protein